MGPEAEDEDEVVAVEAISSGSGVFSSRGEMGSGSSRGLRGRGLFDRGLGDAEWLRGLAEPRGLTPLLGLPKPPECLKGTPRGMLGVGDERRFFSLSSSSMRLGETYLRRGEGGR